MQIYKYITYKIMTKISFVKILSDLHYFISQIKEKGKHLLNDFVCYVIEIKEFV